VLGQAPATSHFSRLFFGFFFFSRFEVFHTLGLLPGIGGVWKSGIFYFPGPSLLLEAAIFAAFFWFFVAPKKIKELNSRQAT
jgi:hypothetical protein